MNPPKKQQQKNNNNNNNNNKKHNNKKQNNQTYIHIKDQGTFSTVVNMLIGAEKSIKNCIINGIRRSPGFSTFKLTNPWPKQFSHTTVACIKVNNTPKRSNLTIFFTQLLTHFHPHDINISSCKGLDILSQS